MGYMLGRNCTLAYKVGTHTGGGAWTTITNVRDLNLGNESSKTDVTTRGSGGWRQRANVLKDGKLEWDMVKDNDDAAFIALRNAYNAGGQGNLVGLRVLDEDGYGWSGDYAIDLQETQNLEEAVMVSVTAELTYSANPPTLLSP